MIVAGHAYLAEYNTADEALIATYEFKYTCKRRARGVFAYEDERYESKIQDRTSTEEHKQIARDFSERLQRERAGVYRIYVERPFKEYEPPLDVCTLLDKAKSWKAVSIAHPWEWE